MAGIAVSGIGSGLRSERTGNAADHGTSRASNTHNQFARSGLSGTHFWVRVAKVRLGGFPNHIGRGFELRQASPRRSAISNDGSALSAAADGTAVSGVYSAEVNQLAQSQKLASKAFSESTETIGEGTLTFRFGTYDSDANTFAADAGAQCSVAYHRQF